MALSGGMPPDLPEQSTQNQMPDSESESDPEDQPAPTCGTGRSVGTFLGTQVIHSGHFMVSSPHSDSTPRRRKSGATVGYDFDTVNRTWCQTYKFGPLSSGSLNIDPTLTRLFECMSLAYSGQIVSPKWKSFKGLRLLWRDKIRLNNAIWRAWFIQYVQKRRSPVCGFVTPMEGAEADAHRKPAAIVLEGSYWKSRIEVVIKEYHKWRIYYKKRKNKNDLFSMLHQYKMIWKPYEWQLDGICEVLLFFFIFGDKILIARGLQSTREWDFQNQGPICQAELEKWSSQMYQKSESVPEEAHMFDVDCFLSNISDTLFTMTQKPCPWSSERHNAYTTNADMIQPGLTPLQPNLDDFMDIPDIFMNFRSQPSEQAGFADCDFFQSPSSGPYAPALSPEVTTSQLIATHLTEPCLSSSLSQPSLSSVRTDPPRTGQGSSEYHIPNIISGAMPYGHQSYLDPPVSIVMPSAQPLVSASGRFLYAPPCQKYGYSPTNATSVTSTVITHTASTLGNLGSEAQAHGYLTAGDIYPQTPCPYVSDLPVSPGSATPTSTLSHCFSVPEQGGVRGKHKQKMAGMKLAGPPVAPPGPPSATFSTTSCLAQLLSSSARERKPVLESSMATKRQKPTPPSSSQSGRSTQAGGAPSQCSPHVTGWSSGLPLLTVQGQGQAQAQASTSRDAATSDLLTHTSPNLLIPKTEKLSPVPIYGTEKNCLTVNFSGHPMSPDNPQEKASYPEVPNSFSVHGKIESKQTETRRITHISAEQKRRFNIKMGFDTLQNLVTTISSQPSIKISKATTLQKTAEYISKMQQERAQLHEEAQRLREEIQALNSSINICQQQLPATGVPITSQRFDSMREKFKEYVRAQTLQNWKFWIFSIIIEPLFESYNRMVSTASVEELCRSTLSWVDQHCSLPALRPMVLHSLRLLSTSTAILTDPSLLPEQATLGVAHGNATAVLDPMLQHTTQNSARPM